MERRAFNYFSVQVVFGNKLFLKYSSNTIVSQNATVSNILIYLAVIKKISINT
jgi:hypothetical protein